MYVDKIVDSNFFIEKIVTYWHPLFISVKGRKGTEFYLYRFDIYGEIYTKYNLNISSGTALVPRAEPEVELNNFLGFKKLVSNRGYHGELAVFSETEGGVVQEIPCQEKCDKCESSKRLEIDELGCKWQTFSGKFFMVSGANISCACARSPKGIAPYTHLGDGMVHLVLVKHTSVLNNLRLLLRLSSSDSCIEDLPFVEILSAREFCFRATEGSSKWNCDGEVQHQINIRAK